ncbi:hypothetical protein DXG03_005565 [Asterophora parasitica]|uniref:C2H2-type domain-containing protein n=1 Tax=Asterophora parasitica TaxID=117018 RepID=A0A9P7K370_9AGAR|nr:hypothetical protein DXG03_005565 [Asterophora parasitica]
MSSAHQDSGMCYDALCDRYFDSRKQRREHVANSLKHPQCEKCDTRYLNKEILRTHMALSKYHNYCMACDVDFETAGGYRVHIEQASVHNDDSDDEDEDDDDSSVPPLVAGREDELGAILYPYEDDILSERRGEYSDGDDSFEDCDEYDFEDDEDLGDIPDEVEIVGSDEEEEDDDLEELGEKFECAVAFDIQGSCPECDEAGTMEQLRKLYISV